MVESKKDNLLEVIGFIYVIAMLTVYIISLAIGVGVALVDGLR